MRKRKKNQETKNTTLKSWNAGIISYFVAFNFYKLKM
jgi:hypothetical protein